MIQFNEEQFIDFLSYSVTLFSVGPIPRSDMAEQLYAQLVGWA